MDWTKQKGTPEAWVSDDGRYRIEKHPFASKYMLTDRGAFEGISPSLQAAQKAAERRHPEKG